MPASGRPSAPPGAVDAPSADSARRSVVPAAAGRSLWLAAVWTGAGAALACLLVGVVAVAVCWLPVSGGSGGAGTVLRAGALTFLAALHGGVTVDGLPTAFVPLGMTLLVALVAWRAGCGLADAAEELDEDDRTRLLRAGLAQAAAFAVVAAVAAALAPLGTSRAPVFAALVAGFLLFAVSGGAAFVRWSALGAALDLPDRLRRAVRAAAAGLAVYLGGGALLVAGALVVHHDRVEELSRQVGGGWSGLPVLLLGLLAAPNAALAGASYLLGPGFAVGAGNHVSALTAAHGVVPAFPVLGGLPTGHGAPWPVWVLMALVAVAAGGVVARAVAPAGGTGDRLRDAATAAGLTAPAGLVLAWQGGGSIGSGRLAAVGASPWQIGLALPVVLAAVSAALIGLGVLVSALRRRADTDEASGLLKASVAVVAAGVAEYRHERDEAAERDQPAAGGPDPGRAAPRDDKLAG